MALWPKDSTPAAPAASHNADSKAARPAAPSVVPADVHTQSKDRADMKESVIAAGLTIEGKIVGTGHVRVAGKFSEFIASVVIGFFYLSWVDADGCVNA